MSNQISLEQIESQIVTTNKWLTSLSQLKDAVLDRVAMQTIKGDIPDITNIHTYADDSTLLYLNNRIEALTRLLTKLKSQANTAIPEKEINQAEYNRLLEKYRFTATQVKDLYPYPLNDYERNIPAESFLTYLANCGSSRYVAYQYTLNELSSISNQLTRVPGIENGKVWIDIKTIRDETGITALL